MIGYNRLILSSMDAYADMRPNESLGSEFTRYMGTIGREYYCDLQLKEVGTFSTDMGRTSFKDRGWFTDET